MPRLRPMSSSDRVRFHRKRLRAAILGSAAVEATKYLQGVVADAGATSQARITAAKALLDGALRLAVKPQVDDAPRVSILNVLAKIAGVPSAETGADAAGNTLPHAKIDGKPSNGTAVGNW